jgi:hypothetical protein
VVTGHGRLAGVSNYLRGEDPGGWLTGVPHYARVTYRGLYDGVDLDRYANFYVTGSTTSTDFPTTGRAFQGSFGGEEDAFVTKLNRSGSGLVWSTPPSSAAPAWTAPTTGSSTGPATSTWMAPPARPTSR